MWIAILAAVATAVTNATAALLQEKEARGEAQQESMRLRLLVDLAKDPRWLLGTGFVVLTFGLHGLALAFGPLALVQPIVLLRMPFAVPMAARQRHDRMGRREWLALLLSTVGLAGFIVIADPKGGNPLPDTMPWVWTGVALGAAVALCVLLAPKGASTRRAGLLGTAAGLMFAAQAVLMRSTTDVLRTRGFGAMLGSWELWVLVGVAVVAMLFQQSAYQAGAFAASRPPLDVSQLVASVMVGLVLFEEVIRKDRLSLIGEAVGIAAAVVGVILLARSPLAEKESRRQRKQEPARAEAHA